MLKRIEIESQTLDGHTLASLVELTPNPILLFDSAGQLRYSNRAASELARRNGCAHVADLMPGAFETRLTACANGAHSASLEGPIGGSHFTWSFFPLENEGWAGCVGTDVTVRSSLQQQLHAVQKSLLVGSLRPSLARDLNNVLTVIQGQVCLLRNASGVTPAIADSLRSIAVAAQGASRLIHQVDRFGREIPTLVSVDLNAVLTGLSPLLGRVLREDVTVQFHCAHELPPVEADPSELEQVLLILASNARDAMPQGGSVTWQTAWIDLDRDDERPGRPVGSYVCLSCTDTGCGMDKAVQSRLFEGLFTTKKEGNGLGLFVAQQIARKHHGWIEVRSQAGEGSTFTLWLPSGAAAPIHVAGSGHWDGNETILVVEDEPAVRLTIRSLLERSGYKVFEAANSVEALAVWHRHHDDIGLLLTDMVLPSGLSGDELAERFRTQKPALNVIYTSGYAPEVASRDGAGVDHFTFLEKPFEADRLLQLVRESLDGTRRE